MLRFQVCAAMQFMGAGDWACAKSTLVTRPHPQTFSLLLSKMRVLACDGETPGGSQGWELVVFKVLRGEEDHSTAVYTV